MVEQLSIMQLLNPAWTSFLSLKNSVSRIIFFSWALAPWTFSTFVSLSVGRMVELGIASWHVGLACIEDQGFHLLNLVFAPMYLTKIHANLGLLEQGKGCSGHWASSDIRKVHDAYGIWAIRSIYICTANTSQASHPFQHSSRDNAQAIIKHQYFGTRCTIWKIKDYC